MARPPKSYLKDTHPELVAQLVDKSLAETLATGSNSSVEWECEHGHRWFARVYNRTNARNKTGCPVCSGKMVVKGVNDLATVRPDVAALCADPKDGFTHAVTSNKKVRWRCEHGHEWVAPVSRLTVQGSRCPYCSGRYSILGENDLATLRPDLAEQLVDKSLATVLKPTSATRVLWRCEYGHEWEATPYDRTGKGSGCPYCVGRYISEGENDLAMVAPEYAATLANPELAKTVGRHSDVKLEWVCQRNSRHRWMATPGNRLASSVDAGCPICDCKKIVPGENDLATTHPEIAVELVDQSLATQLSAGSGRRVRWCCSKGHEWETTVYHRTAKNATGCPVCNPTGSSRAEKDLAGCVRALVPGETVETNVTGMLGGRLELDVVVPSHKLAVEFNGVRWHSEGMGKSRSYHRDKMYECAKLGYQLVQVWEDDWSARKAVVIRMLAAKLGATSALAEAFPEIDSICSERVYARKLRPTSVPGSVAARFLDENHVQGKVTASEHFGLVDDKGRLRAVFSVRSPRNSARMHRSEGEWEIQRYATCGTVVGGFTKLMRYAENALFSRGADLRSWVSFSSNDVSDGSMYIKCGFTLDRELPPDYRYVGDKIGWWRHPKEKFQKKRFMEDPAFVWEDGWTERQAADANGLLRVWDAGKVRWVRDVEPAGAGFVEADPIDMTVVKCLVSDEIVSKAAEDVDGLADCVIITVDPVETVSVPSKRRPGSPLIDLAGKVLGDWKVIERVDDRVDAHGKHWPMWSCECVHCGERTVAGGDRLRNRTVKMCACRKAARKAGKEKVWRKRRSDARPMSQELVSQLVDKSNADLPASSHEKVMWCCEKGHEWKAEVASRTAGHGCPYCSGRFPVPGVDDLATLRPDLAAELVHPELATTVGVGSAKKLEWRCSENPEHTWTAEVRARCGTNRGRGTGCPHCANMGVRSEKRLPPVVDVMPKLLVEAVDPAALDGLSAGSGVKVWWKCNGGGVSHAYEMEVRRKVGGEGCPVCAGKSVEPGVNDLATTHPDLVSELVDPAQALSASRGSEKVLRWRCQEGHEWEAPVYSRVAGNGCPICWNGGSSKMEDELYEAVVSLVGEDRVERHNQSILSGRYELDIVVHDAKVAVEFNGLYWHSVDAGKDPMYHHRKWEKVREAGYRLIQIWEDDWRYRRDACVKMIAAKLGYGRGGRVYARDLSVEGVSGVEAAMFMDANHIQGRCNAQWHFGLRQGDELVAVMSVRRTRDAGTLEICRYATSKQVVGGFSRLLAHAEDGLKTTGEQLSKWVSFSANDVSDGGMYAACGFEVIREVPPEYMYAGRFTGMRRVSKRSFQRKRFREDPKLLWDESWTETEAAKRNGLWRCYDSGKLKWAKEVQVNRQSDTHDAL